MQSIKTFYIFHITLIPPPSHPLLTQLKISSIPKFQITEIGAFLSVCLNHEIISFSSSLHLSLSFSVSILSVFRYASSVGCCHFSYHIEIIRSLSASASQHAANNERESALQSAAAASAAAALGQDSHTTPAAPPNYEELDPPPAYSVLFPNQKAASSNTLNSLDVQGSTQQQQHLQLSPSAAPSSRSTARTYAERAATSSTNNPNN